MSVPNQYKGFSRLPEHVQRRMDPQLAQKYQMGGAVMQRPLFRQAGGPAQPMPQDMAPPQGMMPAGPDANMGQDMANIEQAVSGQMEQAGQEYAMRMMQGLDAAEDYKGVIDSLRGNDRPIEARYQELAGLVGAEDAQATPESVLTLVQPTIMMTEQGAMDSGIGELMQAVAGQVDMQTADGAPTDMAGGVGSLMAAGAGNTPPANFSQGGPVRLQAGGNPQLEKYYQDMLPLYESILGDSAQQKEMSQAQALFAIADAAGRFASGQGAGGQDLRGLSPAAQLGGAITGLGGQLGALGAQTAEQERAMKLAALQAAQGEYSADRAAARAAGTKGIGEIYEVVGPDGKVVTTVPLTTQADFDALQKKYPNTTVRKQYKPAAPDMVTMLNITDPTQSIAVNTNDAAAYSAAVAGGFLPTTDLKTIKELQSPDAKPMNLYKDGEVVSFNLALPEHQTRYNELLNKPGWTADPTQYASQIQQNKEMAVFNQQEEVRVANKIAEELRQQGYQIAAEDRAVLQAIAKEERQNGYTLSKEEREQRYLLAKESRDLARTIEAELRQQGYDIAAEDRALLQQIAKEERDLGRTLSAEERAQRYDAFKFNRDQEATIAQELRQQGYVKAGEERDLVRQIAAEERALNRTLSAEERSQRYDAFVFERDQAAKIEAELRAENRTISAEDRALTRAIAAEERALGRALSKEERQQRYDQFIFERDQAVKPVKGIPRDMFDKLSTEVQNRIIAGDPKDPQTVKGIPRDIYDALSPETQRSIVAGDEAPKTLIERQQQVLLDQDTITQFASGALSPEKTSELVTVLQAYTAPSQGPQGTTTSKPIPVNIQRALKQRQELGLDTFGIDPALFGQAISANDFDQLTQNIIDPNVDLEKGAGFLSGLASAINYIGEQTIGELGVGSGTAFKGTKEAKQALQALSSSTRKFALEGRQLAQELNLQLAELPDGAFTTSDAKTLSNIQTQQQQLDMFVQRVTEALKTPQSFTSSDLSKVRQQLNFAVQLKKAYDAAYNNLAPGAGGKTTGDKPKASDFRR